MVVFKYQHSLFRQRNHHTEGKEKVRQSRELQTPYNDKKLWRGAGESKFYPTEALEVLLVLERHAELLLIKTRPDWVADGGAEGRKQTTNPFPLKLNTFSQEQ